MCVVPVALHPSKASSRKLKTCSRSSIFWIVREWTLYICRMCGDYDLGGWEGLLHLPNQWCPGINEPSLVDEVTAVSKLEVLMRDAQLGILDRALLG